MAVPQTYRPQRYFDSPLISATPAAMVRGPARLGVWVIGLFVAVFFGWGAVAPLAGGAFAPGTIAPDGSVRTVQHLEGGIVGEFFVKEGDRVEAGAPLLALEKVAGEATVTALMDRRRARLAESARLEAELMGQYSIDFPAELLSDPAAAPAIEAEHRIFIARTAMLSSKRSELEQGIRQLEEQINGFEAQVASAEEQLRLIRQEIADKKTLLDQGLTPKAEFLRLKRGEAEILGFRGQNKAAIAQARQQIGQTRIELLGLDAERMQEVSLRAGEIRTELSDIEQTLAAQRDVLKRTVIDAPVAGVVNNLRIKTKGGVVMPGEPILDIVPTEEKLVINVQIKPDDIDVVEAGMTALVHLTALSGRTTPRLAGQVTSVSAERIIDERTGQAHFTARVEVERHALKAIGDPKLSVGMPAEVVIVSKERTMMNYLLQPLTDALRRAGREV
jgi:HlyD family type I secretion membrane fusion protein